jgi:PHD/YefM family antitoxin component YafN of YafNO toxin-antitoxin module
VAIETDNRELVGQRDFYRGFAKHMLRLGEGEVEKIVITKNGKMVGVLMTPDKYEALVGERS